MTNPAPAVSQTLKNLQAAYEGESNAAVRYAAFAVKAEEDGYRRVAALFKAASRAEQIHLANHAKVIQRMGATPEAKIAEPVVLSTAENLAAAKAGEEYERDVMYPEFIHQAEAQGESGALRSFRLAREAEAVHAALYGAALAALDQQKAGATFFVCPICGEVTDDATLKTCPICNASAEKFESFTV